MVAVLLQHPRAQHPFFSCVPRRYMLMVRASWDPKASSYVAAFRKIDGVERLGTQTIHHHGTPFRDNEAIVDSGVFPGMGRCGKNPELTSVRAVVVDSSDFPERDQQWDPETSLEAKTVMGVDGWRLLMNKNSWGASLHFRPSRGIMLEDQL